MKTVYAVRDREAGNIISWMDTREEAEAEVERYEAIDREEGTYTPDFYEVAEIECGEEIRLVKEGYYWTLYIGETQCCCGYFEDMIDMISEFSTWEQAIQFVEECNEVR